MGETVLDRGHRELGVGYGPTLGPSARRCLSLRQAQSLSPISPVHAAQCSAPPGPRVSGSGVSLPPQLWAAQPAHPLQPSHPCLCLHPAFPKTPAASLCWAALGTGPAPAALLSSPSVSPLPSLPPPLLAGPSRVPGAPVRQPFLPLRLLCRLSAHP